MKKYGSGRFCKLYPDKCTSVIKQDYQMILTVDYLSLSGIFNIAMFLVGYYVFLSFIFKKIKKVVSKSTS